MKTQHIITTAAALAAILTTTTWPAPAAEPPAPYGAVPTEQQIQWQRLEWYAFVHYGLSTYSQGVDFAYGDEDPALLDPSDFDANEIVEICKEAGMTGLIFTAKHHVGFCHWPTESTEYNITKSPWKDGKGDMVRDFADACKKHGMLYGIYISPWDRNSAEYGQPGYRDIFYKQIEESLDNYGDIFEMWFDGCTWGDGYYGGAREMRLVDDADTYYGFAHVAEIIRKKQPNCIIWGAEGHGDVVWGGSEAGTVKYPNWNVTTAVGHATESAPRNLPDTPAPNERWMPFEADTSITMWFWFWHRGHLTHLISPKRLMNGVYMNSVGRGANLILNLPLDEDGKLNSHAKDVLVRFAEARRKLLDKDYALNAKGTASNVRGGDIQQFGPEKLTDNDIESYWCTDDDSTTGEVELILDAPATFDVVRVREQIRLGQRVQNFAVDAWVDGKWVTIDADEANGKSIGNQVMRRVQPTTTDKVRLRITKSRACPCISELSLLKMPDESELEFTTCEEIQIYLSHFEPWMLISGGIILLLAVLVLVGTVIKVRRRKRARRETKVTP